MIYQFLLVVSHIEGCVENVIGELISISGLVSCIHFRTNAIVKGMNLSFPSYA